MAQDPYRERSSFEFAGVHLEDTRLTLPEQYLHIPYHKIRDSSVGFSILPLTSSNCFSMIWKMFSIVFLGIELQTRCNTENVADSPQLKPLRLSTCCGIPGAYPQARWLLGYAPEPGNQGNQQESSTEFDMLDMFDCLDFASFRMFPSHMGSLSLFIFVHWSDLQVGKRTA